MSSSRASRRSSTGATTLNIATIGLLDKSRLVKELSERGLETTGNKDTLSQRLYDFVINGGVVAPAAPPAKVAPTPPKKKAAPKKVVVKVEEPDPEEVPEEEEEKVPEEKPQIPPKKAPKAQKKAAPKARGRPKRKEIIEIEDDAPDLQLLVKSAPVEDMMEQEEFMRREDENLKSVTTRSGRKTTVKVETPEPESSPSPAPEPQPLKTIKQEPERTPTPPPPSEVVTSSEPIEKRARQKSPEPDVKPTITRIPSAPGPTKRPRASSGTAENDTKRSKPEKEKEKEKPMMKPKPATWKEQWAAKMKEMKTEQSSNITEKEKPKVVEKRKESTETTAKRKESPVEVDVISAIMSSTIPKPKPPKPEDLPPLQPPKPLRVDTEYRAHGGSDSSNRQQHRPSPWNSNSPAQPSPHVVLAKNDIPPPPPRNALGQARDTLLPPPPPPKVMSIPPPPPKLVAPPAQTRLVAPPPPPKVMSIPPPPPKVVSKLEQPKMAPPTTILQNVPIPSAVPAHNIPLPTSSAQPAAITAQPRRRSRFDQPPPEYVQKYYQDMYTVATPPPKLATLLKISTPRTPPKQDLKSRIAEVFELDLKPQVPSKVAQEQKEQEAEEDDDDDFVIRETVVETEPVIKRAEAEREKGEKEVEDDREEEEDDEEEEEYDPFENTTINSECVEYYPSFAQENEENDEEGPSTSQKHQEPDAEMEEEAENPDDDMEDVEEYNQADRSNPDETQEGEEVETKIDSPEISAVNTSALDLLKLALPVLQSLTTNVEEEEEKMDEADFCQIIEESVLLEEKEKENPEDVYYHGDPVPEIDENELFEIAAGIKPAKKKEKKSLVQIPEEERSPAQSQVELDYYNASIHIKSAEDNIWKIEPFSQDGLALMWGSVRSNFGLKIPSKACRRLGFQIEVESFPSIQHLPTEFVHESGDVRVGFSLGSAPLILGEYSGSWCISSSGKKATNNHFSDFKTTFGVNDVITCVLDFDKCSIEYWKNGESIGVAFENVVFKEGDLVFPTICVKHTIVNVNLGQDTDEEKWKIPSSRDWKFLTEIADNEQHVERTRQPPESKSACTVLMTIGLPGVGKTTWVRRYLSEHPHEHWTIISADVVVDSMRINGVPRNRMPNLKRPDFLRGIIGKSMARLILLAPRRRKNYVLDMANCLLEKRKRKLMAFEDFNRKCMIFVPDEDVHLKRLIKQEHEENEKLDTDALMQHKAAMSLPSTENDPCEAIIFIDPPSPYEHLAFERVAKMNQDCKGWLMTGNRKRGGQGGFHQKSNLTINTHTYSHMNSGPSSDFSPRSGGGGFNVTHTTFQSNSSFTPKEKSPPVTIKTDLTKPLYINMSGGYNNRRSIDSSTGGAPGPSSSSNNPMTPSSRRPSIGEPSPQMMIHTPNAAATTPRIMVPNTVQQPPIFPFPCDVNLPPPDFSLPPPPFPQGAQLIYPPPIQQQPQMFAAIPPPNMHFAPPK